MGDQDRPFSERMWGLGRRLAPTQVGRRGCMLMLVATTVAIVAAALLSLAIGGR